MRTANLALKFGLEIAAVAAFAIWGAAAGGAAGVALAIVSPAAMIAVWTLFAAPRSSRRLVPAARIPLELSIFTLAAIGLVAAGYEGVAVAFGVPAVLNALLLTVFGQWES